MNGMKIRGSVKSVKVTGGRDLENNYRAGALGQPRRSRSLTEEPRLRLTERGEYGVIGSRGPEGLPSSRRGPAVV